MPDHLPLSPPGSMWNGGSAKVRPKQQFTLYPACVRCLGRSAAHPPSPILIAEGCGEVATTQLPMSHYQCRSSCGGATFFPSTESLALSFVPTSVPVSAMHIGRGFRNFWSEFVRFLILERGEYGCSGEPSSGCLERTSTQQLSSPNPKGLG